ncbi:MAG: hypothetical protein QF860_15610 [Planctomycetota bacterium]|jgi:hypothetical protein|nr:hypothetical protein [Planctomycetota bacterium]
MTPMLAIPFYDGLSGGLQGIAHVLFWFVFLPVMLTDLVALVFNARLLYRPPARRSKRVTFALVASMIFGLLNIYLCLYHVRRDSALPWLLLFGGVLLLWMTVANLRRSSDSRMLKLEMARRSR